MGGLPGRVFCYKVDLPREGSVTNRATPSSVISISPRFTFPLWQHNPSRYCGDLFSSIFCQSMRLGRPWETNFSGLSQNLNLVANSMGKIYPRCFASHLLKCLSLNHQYQAVLSNLIVSSHLMHFYTCTCVACCMLHVYWLIASPSLSSRNI